MPAITNRAASRRGAGARRGTGAGGGKRKAGSGRMEADIRRQGSGHPKCGGGHFFDVKFIDPNKAKEKSDGTGLQCSAGCPCGCQREG